MVIATFENLFTEFGDPFLKSAQWTNPAAEDWTSEDGQDQSDDHQNQRGLMNLLNESAGGDELIECYHPTEGTERMQGDGGEKGDIFTRLSQGVIYCDESDKNKKE